MIETLIEKLDEQDFEDMFQPATKDELIKKRGWFLLSRERSEVKHLDSYDEVKKYSRLPESKFKSYYRQGYNFYGIRDRESGNTYLVTVDLNKHLSLYNVSGQSINYYME